MGLFGSHPRRPGVSPGDAFRKAGTYGGNWIVEKVFEYPDIPSHARLTEQNGSRTMTVAVSLLLDTNNFVLVSNAETCQP